MQGTRRALGSFGGASAPWPWRAIGSPATGALVQGAVLGGMGYGGGKLVNWITGKDTELPATLATGGALTGLALNALPVLNARAQAVTEGRSPFAAMFHSPMRGHVKGSQLLKMADAFGFGIPANHTYGMIMADPLLSPIEKARALSIVDDAADANRTGMITWPNVARAAAGAGVGYAGATLFAKVVDGVFGGISQQSQRRLQATGVIGGILKATGVL